MAAIPDSPQIDDGDFDDWSESQGQTIQTSRPVNEAVEQRSSRGRRCFGSRPRRNNLQKQIINTESAMFDDCLNSSQSSMSFCSDSIIRRTSASSISSFSSLQNASSNSIMSNMGSSDPSIGGLSSGSSSSSRREVPPLRPSKKNHRRSISLCPGVPAIPRPTPLNRPSKSSTGTPTSFSQDSSSWGKENLAEDERELSPSISQRRMVRAKRRNSMSCSVPSLHKSTSLHKSGSMTVLPSRMGNSLTNGSMHCKRPATATLCRRNSISSFPFSGPASLSLSLSAENITTGDDAWMYQVSNLRGPESPPKLPPKLPKMDRFDSGDLTEYTSSSPGTPSVTTTTSVCSSRKRGMSEEPSEDADDGSSVFSGYSARRTTYANNIASRSCQAKGVSPRPPSLDRLDMGQETISYVPIEATASTKHELYEQRKKHITDYLSDSEDEDNEDDESVNSMSEDEPVQDSMSSPSSVRGVVTREEDVLDTMTSIEDLKFLITTLRRQKSSSKSCTVILPTKWLADRRKKFVEWSEHKLGFTVRQSDPTNSYLEILRPKAMSNLDLLESASDIYKAKQHEVKTTPGIESTGFSNKKQQLILDTASTMTTAAKEKLSSVLVPSLGSRGHGDVTEDIAAQLDSLSLNKEKDTPLVRHVTIDGNDTTKSRPPLFQPDLSPPVEAPAPSRLSLDSHALADDDLAFIFQGHTPAGPECRSKRPPKLSIGSVNSNLSIPRRMDITPMNSVVATTATTAAPPCGGFDFVTTPLMKQTTWGSRPIEGRDWGSSEECDGDILEELMILFETSCAEAGVSDLSPGLAENRNANQNLQLDLDVEAGTDDENSYENNDSDEESDGFVMIDNGISSLDAPDVLTSGGRMLRDLRRRTSSLGKHKRMSVCLSSSSSSGPRRSYLFQRKPLFDSRQSLNLKTHTRDLSIGVDCFLPHVGSHDRLNNEQPLIEVLAEKGVLIKVFGFLDGQELLTSVSLVCSSWADASTDAYAQLMIASVGCASDYDGEANDEEIEPVENSVAQSMSRSWQYLTREFPYGSFLGSGSYKSVYKVKNASMKSSEAISIMDINLLEEVGQKDVVATELAVSVMLSSLARRGICPNFVVTRGVFTCPFQPPASHWGSEQNKNHEVHTQGTPKGRRRPRQPAAKHRGRYQYIRMELCEKGDLEEYIKDQPKELLSVEMSRILLFQISFALHAAASKYCLKHYDLKLLNVFLQDASSVPGAKESATGNTVLRYGLGSKVFALRMPTEKALLAKVADYGTADVKSETNGQPISMGQFTTLENTPPEFLIKGDLAKQGHEHDLFGLGLCMLHLFTGKAPYEEILEDVKCPVFFKELLRGIWEDENSKGYSVIRSVILLDVFKDDEGQIIEGEPDETFYDTLYRYLVLFGIPEHKSAQKKHGKVWGAISESLTDRASSKRGITAASQFGRDQTKYSLSFGTNKYIARARRNLESATGGMELLTSLVNFDPEARATALDVLNSDFFATLREPANTSYRSRDDVRSFTAFSTV